MYSTCHSLQEFSNSCVLDISSKRKNFLWAISNWFQWIISLFYLPGLLVFFSLLLFYCHACSSFPNSLQSGDMPASGEKAAGMQLCYLFYCPVTCLKVHVCPERRNKEDNQCGFATEVFLTDTEDLFGCSCITFYCLQKVKKTT